MKIKLKISFSHSKNQDHVEKFHPDLLKVKHYDAKIAIILNEKKNSGNVNQCLCLLVKKNPKIENVITIWGEEIIINKRKVKLGEFVIKKHEVTETKKDRSRINNRKINYTSTRFIKRRNNLKI